MVTWLAMELTNGMFEQTVCRAPSSCTENAAHFNKHLATALSRLVGENNTLI